MADRVDIKLKSTSPNDEKINTTISYINPEAQNSEMMQFAQRLNQLTRNTYSASDKIETTNLDFAPDSRQQTPTLTLAQTSMTVAEVNATNHPATGGGPIQLYFTYDGDGLVRAAITDSTAAVRTYCSALQSPTGGTIFIYSWVEAQPCEILVTADATENYKAASATFTITT